MIIITKILAGLVLLTQICGIVLLLSLINARARKIILPFLKQKAILLAFCVALIATSGSLFFSTIVGYAPCELCWFQRIFMYPLVVLFGMALYKKREEIVDYALLLAIIGLFISAYHNYIIFVASRATSCSAGVSCTTKYFVEFGYITIPMMALTAFSAIIFLLLIKKIKE